MADSQFQNRVATLPTPPFLSTATTASRRSVSSTTSTSTFPATRFGGSLGYGLGGLALTAPVVSAFSAVDQKNSMVSVACRDGFDSSGRVYQEFQRNRYGGWESLITEGSGMLVWGFGISLCKKLYDHLAPQLSQGRILFPELNELGLLPQPREEQKIKRKAGLFQKLGTSLKQSDVVQGWNRLAEKPGFDYILGRIGSQPDSVPSRGKAHVLDRGTIERYYRPVQHLPLESDSESLRRHLSGEQIKANTCSKTHELRIFADFEERKRHLLQLATSESGANKAHMVRYMRHNMLKLILCTSLPSLALGVLIPTLLHWLTPKLVKHDKHNQDKKRERFWQNLNFPNYFNPASHTRNVVVPSRSNREQANIDASFAKSRAHWFQKETAFVPNPAHNASSANSPHFGGIEAMLNPAVSWFLARDTVSTMTFVDLPLSGSRVATARNKDERKEILFRELALITVLFWAQRAIQERINKGFDRKFNAHTNIEIKALHRLASQFGGLPPETLRQALEPHRELLALVSQSQHSLEGEKKLVAAVREYFSDERKQASNLLFDLAEVSQKIPTLGKGGKKYVGKNGVHYIDLTQKIDTDGLREMAAYLQHLELQLANGQSLHEAVAKNAAMKMGAFGLSAMACWTIVSYIVPKVQHYITFRERGTRQFPGLDKSDAQNQAA